MALMKLGRVDEAIVELERGLAIKDSATAEYNLAIAHGMKGDFAGAVAPLTRAVTLKPDYPVAWAHLVEAAARLEMRKQVIELVVQARESCPSCATDPAYQSMIDNLGRFHHDAAK
jgi:Flp pilus assembly protein TadD